MIGVCQLCREIIDAGLGAKQLAAIAPADRQLAEYQALGARMFQHVVGVGNNPKHREQKVHADLFEQLSQNQAGLAFFLLSLALTGGPAVDAERERARQELIRIIQEAGRVIAPASGDLPPAA